MVRIAAAPNRRTTSLVFLLVCAAIPTMALPNFARAESLELYVETRTSDASVTATSSGSANIIIQGNSVAYDGSPVMVEFYSPQYQHATGVVTSIALYVDGSLYADVNRKNGSGSNLFTSIRYTPSAGNHTLSIRGYLSATGTATVGCGGTDRAPCYLRITRANPTYLTEAEADALYSPVSHNHDALYSPVSHNHDSRYCLKDGSETDPDCGSGGGGGSVDWGGITGKPSVFPPESHTHDEYLTEEEADALYCLVSGTNCDISGGGGGGGGGTFASCPDSPANPGDMPDAAIEVRYQRQEISTFCNAVLGAMGETQMVAFDPATRNVADLSEEDKQILEWILYAVAFGIGIGTTVYGLGFLRRGIFGE